MSLLDLFHKGLDSDNWHERLKAVLEIEDEAILFKVALEDPDMAVATTAAKRISNPEFATELLDRSDREEIQAIALSKAGDATLVHTVMNHDNENVQRVALSHIEDPGALYKVASEHSSVGIRCEAAGSISNEEMLMSLYQSEESEVVRWTIVGCLREQENLTQIACNDRFYSVRQDAAKRIIDRDVLLRILQDDHPEVRATVVPRLRDHEVIRDVVRSDPEALVRHAAVILIKDEALLFEVAANDPDRTVQQLALGRIQDQALIVRLAKESADTVLRHLAAKRIKDDALRLSLTEVPKSFASEASVDRDLHRQEAEAKHDEEAAMREQVRRVTALTAPAELADVLLNNELPECRLAVVERVMDKAALSQCALNDPDAGVRLRAVDRSRDQNTLVQVATTDSEAQIRSVAARKVKIPAMLAQIATADSVSEVRTIAVGRLEDEAFLAELAKSCPHADIRNAAVFKIRNADLLADIAANSTDDEIRHQAAYRASSMR